MANSKGLDKLEIAIHIIFVLVGVIFLGGAYFTPTDDSFWRPLLINVGTSLIVVTIIFSIFEALRRENAETNVLVERSQFYDAEEQSRVREAKLVLIQSQDMPAQRATIGKSDGDNHG